MLFEFLNIIKAVFQANKIVILMPAVEQVMALPGTNSKDHITCMLS